MSGRSARMDSQKRIDWTSNLGRRPIIYPQNSRIWMLFRKIYLFQQNFTGLHFFRMQTTSVNSKVLKRKARQLFSIIYAMFRHYSLILIFFLFLSGCQVQLRYSSEIPSETVISNEETFWFWGLIGEKKYELTDLCPQGRVYELRIHNTWMQSTYTALTLGIYSPRTITIVCSIRGE